MQLAVTVITCNSLVSGTKLQNSLFQNGLHSIAMLLFFQLFRKCLDSNMFHILHLHRKQHHFCSLRPTQTLCVTHTSMDVFGSSSPLGMGIFHTQTYDFIFHCCGRFPRGAAQELCWQTTTNPGIYLQTWPQSYTCTHRTNGKVYVANCPTPQDPPGASQRWGTGRPTNPGQ